jgi:putative amide transporter protein
MSSVGLLFVGAVLFMNGLLFLGKADAKGVAVFNLFVGGLQTAIPFYLIATAKTPDDILGAAGIFLFGFTYLYVGIVTLAGFKSDGLTEILRFHDTPTGLLWLQWAVLWSVFFVVLALGVARLTAPAGWLTLILSLTTCTIPGFILLLGDWGKVPTWAVLASIAATAVVVVPLSLRALAEPEPEPELRSAPSDAGVAVSS